MFSGTVIVLIALSSYVYSTTDFFKKEAAKNRYNSQSLSPEKSKIAVDCMVYKLCDDKDGPEQFWYMQKHSEQWKEVHDALNESITSAYENDVQGYQIGTEDWWKALPGGICGQSDKERTEKLTELMRVCALPFTEKGCEETELEPRHETCCGYDCLIEEAMLMMDEAMCRNCCPTTIDGGTFSGTPCSEIEIVGEHCEAPRVTFSENLPPGSPSQTFG